MVEAILVPAFAILAFLAPLAPIFAMTVMFIIQVFIVYLFAKALVRYILKELKKQ